MHAKIAANDLSFDPLVVELKMICLQSLYAKTCHRKFQKFLSRATII